MCVCVCVCACACVCGVCGVCVCVCVCMCVRAVTDQSSCVVNLFLDGLQQSCVLSLHL